MRWERPECRSGRGIQAAMISLRFQAERVFEDNDIRGALRQAESLGAVGITAVAREDQHDAHVSRPASTRGPTHTPAIWW